MKVLSKHIFLEDLIFFTFFLIRILDDVLVGLISDWTFFLYRNTGYYILIFFVCLWQGLNLKKLVLNKPVDILFLLFCSCLFLRANNWSLINPDVSYALSSIVVYIFFKSYLFGSSRRRVLLIFGLSNALFLLFSVFLPYHSMGIYANSGVLGGYVLTLAFLILYLSNFNLIILLSISCFGLVLFWVDSRAAAVAFAFSFFYYSRSKILWLLKHRLYRWLLIISLPVVLFSINEVYHLRKESAEGRVLIWKITAKSILENDLTHIIFGRGTGTFNKDYNLLQANYFDAEERDTQEIFVSDNVHYAFNEYLKILFENGIIGLLLILLILIKSLRNQSAKNSKAKLSLFGICIFALFSYPFAVLQTYINFIFILALINTDKDLEAKSDQYFYVYCIRTISLVCCLYFGYLSFTYAKGLFAYNNAKRYDLYLKFDKSIQAYEKTIETTKWFGFKYLMDYSLALFRNEQYHKCIVVLENEQLTRTSDSRFFLLLGQAYSKIDDLDKAEAAFKTAKNITPMKLLPKLYLLQHYNNMNNKEQLLKISQEIVRTGEKVSSTQSASIIEIAKAKLKNLTDTCDQDESHTLPKIK